MKIYYIYVFVVVVFFFCLLNVYCTIFILPLLALNWSIKRNF